MDNVNLEHPYQKVLLVIKYSTSKKIQATNDVFKVLLQVIFLCIIRY